MSGRLAVSGGLIFSRGKREGPLPPQRVCGTTTCAESHTTTESAISISIHRQASIGWGSRARSSFHQPSFQRRPSIQRMTVQKVLIWTPLYWIRGSPWKGKRSGIANPGPTGSPDTTRTAGIVSGSVPGDWGWASPTFSTGT